MKLSAPKKITWLIALVAGALGLIMHYRVLHIGVLAPYAFFMIAGSWALLLIASMVRGL